MARDETSQEIDLGRVVRCAVSERPGVTASDLKKVLPKEQRKRAAEAIEIARAMATRGELHRWAKGKKERFFAYDPVETLDGLVPGLLEKPLAAPDLKKVVERSAPGYGDLVPEWLKSALVRRVVYPSAPVPRSKAKRFAREPDARLVLTKTIAQLKKTMSTLDDLGIDRRKAASVLLEELGVASNAERSSHEERERFLDGLAALASREPEGALLSVRELRARLAMDKQRFDGVALALAGEGAIVLHHHDFPASLADSERQQLIVDDRGTHYVGIAPRSRDERSRNAS